MRTNVDNLASDYALIQYPKETVETSKGCFDDLNELNRTLSKDDFKAGFNKCLELLDEVISDYNQDLDPVIKFLEKYKAK